MLAPGSVFGSGKIGITAAAAQAPDFFNEGVGFMNNGGLAVDTGAPAGSLYRAGVRQNAAGAFYGTTSTAGTDIWVGGLLLSILGQIVYEDAASTFYSNGNPLTANGRLAVTVGGGSTFF